MDYDSTEEEVIARTSPRKRKLIRMEMTTDDSQSSPSTPDLELCSSSICFFCLEKSDGGNGGKRDGNSPDLYSRFLHFCEGYLKVESLPTTKNYVSPSGPVFDTKHDIRETMETEEGFAPCRQCERQLSILLNIYGEFTTLRARLLWNVGQLGEILEQASAKRKSSHLIALESFRKEVEEKCHAKAQIIQPGVSVLSLKQSPPPSSPPEELFTTRSGRVIKKPKLYQLQSDGEEGSPAVAADSEHELVIDEDFEDWSKEISDNEEDVTTTTSRGAPAQQNENRHHQSNSSKARWSSSSRRTCLSSRSSRVLKKRKRPSHLTHANKQKSSNTIIRSACSCSHCSAKFRNRLMLLQHMAMAHEGLSEEFLKCAVCDETQESFAELQRHLEEKHEDPERKSIYCVFCYQNFTTQQLSDLHRREQHSKVYLSRCPLLFCDKDDCQEKFMSVVDLNEHLKIHVNPSSQSQGEDVGVFVCPKCGRGFLNSTRCELHQIIHIPKDAEGFYHCPKYEECNIKLRGQRKLLNHYNKKHVEISRRLTLHPCDLCKKRPYFISRKDLETHSKRHALEIQCRICGEVCLGNNELIVHKYNKHPDEFNFNQMPKIKPIKTETMETTATTPQQQEKGKGPNGPTSTSSSTSSSSSSPQPKKNDQAVTSNSINKNNSNNTKMNKPGSEMGGLLRKCAYCPQTFVTFSELEKHKASAHGINANRPQPGRLVCDICGLVVSYKGTLARHMLTHSEPTIECPYKCGRKFRRVGNMEMHLMKTHKKGEYEPQFVCDICGRSYLSRGLLNRHKKEHEKLIKCPMCPKMVRTTSRLKEHVRATHSTERFNCKWCSAVYTWETKLIAHLKKKHPEHYEDYYAERVSWRTQTRIDNEEEYVLPGDSREEVAGTRSSSETLLATTQSQNENIPTEVAHEEVVNTNYTNEGIHLIMFPREANSNSTGEHVETLDEIKDDHNPDVDPDEKMDVAVALSGMACRRNGGK